MAHEIKVQWKCNQCGDRHEDEDEARDCCRPSVTELYVCPVCDDYHYHEHEAVNCCPEEDTDEPPRLSAAELERQGQCRLFN